MHLFIGNIHQNYAELSEEESRHFSKVLRGKVGQEVYVTDGKGQFAKGIVSEIHSKLIHIDLTELQQNYNKRSYKLHVAIAPTKNMDRLEFFLEKATEIGIDEITLLKTFHSERKNINLERCQKIILSAVKQSVKAYIPLVNDMIKFTDFVRQNHSETKLIAHCNEDFERMNFKNLIQAKTDYLLLIGPEGDFSNEEIQFAYENNFQGVSLGNQRLRTETAALNSVFGVEWMNS